jgi:hypothetical protein
MRRTPRSLADARGELVQIQEEFTRLQNRIEAVRDCVTDSLVRFFGEQRPAFTGLKEEELIEGIAGSVVTRLGTTPKPTVKGKQRYVREKEAAAFLGVSVFTLQSWRSIYPNEVPHPILWNQFCDLIGGVAVRVNKKSAVALRKLVAGDAVVADADVHVIKGTKVRRSFLTMSFSCCGRKNLK